MKRVLLLLTFLMAGWGLIYYYQTNSEFKSNLDAWLGDTESDSLQNTTSLDTVTVAEATRQRKNNSTRARIPKKIRPGEFDKLDKYARNTPHKYSRDIADLAAYLKLPARNDLAKARLAYTWIATHIRYDDKAYNTGSYKKQDPDSVLSSRTAVCEGYSALFQRLAHMMGLEVVEIVGYAKGYGFRQGDKFSDTDHAWNAVKINNTWQLIDVTWGSSYGERTTEGLKTTMSFDPYWFSAGPEEFIFSHLPENADWQLNKPTLTLEQFEELPFVRATLFNLAFDPQEVFRNALSGDTKEFVETFPIDFPVDSIDFPLGKGLIQGKEYRFSLHSTYFEEVVIIDQRQWISFKKENDRFSVNYIPRGGELTIAVKINWFDENFRTIAVYDSEDKKLSARNDSY
jgi:hypothetical protein